MSDKEQRLKYIEEHFKVKDGRICERTNCKEPIYGTIRTWPGYYGVCKYHFQNPLG